MFRRIWNGLVLLTAFCQLLLVAQGSSTGSITVETKGGTVALYRVGDFADTQFRLLPEYGGKSVTFDESLSQALAEDLARQARGGYVKAADLHGDVEFTDLESGLYLLVQPTTPQGEEPFAPFLVSIPWDGDQWTVKTAPVWSDLHPQTADRAFPLPWLGIMYVSSVGICWCLLRLWDKFRRT